MSIPNEPIEGHSLPAVLMEFDLWTTLGTEFSMDRNKLKHQLFGFLYRKWDKEIDSTELLKICREHLKCSITVKKLN